jgi:hypothetical protein
MKRRIHLEQLLGRKVKDPAGRTAGHIEEILADWDGRTWTVQAYLLGRGGLADRLSIAGFSGLVVDSLGGYGNPTSQKVPWNQIDLTDPRHPRLRCSVDELKAEK